MLQPVSSSMALLGISLALLGTVRAQSSTIPIVTVVQGSIAGVSTSVPGVALPVFQYLGIPFAAPPERFSPPTVATSFNTTPYDASTFKPSCIQEFSGPEQVQGFNEELFNNPPPTSESEDCLYLNVFTPIGSAKNRTTAALLPVMVWIYGGAFQFGSGGLPVYDGSNLAGNQDLVVVTFNYRTNVFGFPNSPELPLIERNLGLLDQRQALDWVKNNIAAFGGDPTKVTIFGQSAGARSVDLLITSDSYMTPFRAAIMQSGQDGYGPITELSTGGTWDALASGVGCGNASSILACVRAVDALTIQSVAENAELSFQPVIDNVTSVGNPDARRAQGIIADVPILIGSNAQDGTVFTYGESNVTAVVELAVPGNTTMQNALIAAYPVGQDGLATSSDVVAQMYTDWVFNCPAAKVANHSQAAGYPTWRYLYNATFTNIQPYPGLGAYHSSEIGFVFGNLPANSTMEEMALSALMQKAWADFAKNPTGGPGWDSASIAEFRDDGVHNVSVAVLDERCGLFAYANA